MHNLKNGRTANADCRDIAKQTFQKAQARKMKAILVKGTVDEKPGHHWVEYWNEKRKAYCVWDATKSYIGKSVFTAQELDYKDRQILKITIPTVK